MAYRSIYPHLVRGNLIRHCLALGLALLLAIGPLYGDPQTPASPPPAQAPATPAPTGVPPAQAPAAPATPAVQPAQPMAPLPIVQSLKVLPLAGKGGMNDLERKVMSPLVVQIMDQDARPVEGADVVFRFPLNGPGANFTGGKSSQTFRSNGQGQAAALNWRANDQLGAFDVHVTAAYGNQVGETTFQMSNVSRIVDERTAKRKLGSWWSPTWVKLAVIGGAVGIGLGIYFGTRGGGSSASTTTVTITPGTPSVGGPR